MNKAHLQHQNDFRDAPASRSRGAGASRILRLWAFSVLAISIGMACAAPAHSEAPGGAAVVTVTNQLTFEPKEITIRAGESIEWRNISLLVHTVTADPAVAARKESVALPEGAAPFNSGNIMPEGTYRHRFAVPGRYQYFCIPHEGAGMVGTVVVAGPGRASSPASSERKSFSQFR